MLELNAVATELLYSAVICRCSWAVFVKATVVQCFSEGITKAMRTKQVRDCCLEKMQHATQVVFTAVKIALHTIVSEHDHCSSVSCSGTRSTH
jgi:hypothetical protein